MEPKYAKLKELLENEETGRRLVSLSPEDASRVLMDEYNLSFAPEQLIDIANGIKDSAHTENDELSESDLLQVSGGKKGSEDYEFGRAVGRGSPVLVALITIAVLTGW